MGKWNKKVVVVTGGSEGLGHALAMAFASGGAKSVLIARDESRLRAATQLASQSGLDVDWLVGDVTDDQSVTGAFNEIIKRYGRIDVLVNNVGRSTRARFNQCTVDAYKDLIEINFYSAVRCTLAALDHLAASSGQVVNIGSLAAKTGWPNVAPYSVSKHALAAFSHQMRIEGPANVNCLFVCTGPIQRTDASERYDDQMEGLDAAARAPGAGVNLKGIPPEKLARKIVRFCEFRRKELVIPFYTRILFAISQLSPTVGDFLLRRSTKKMDD
jgi:short-subunit dehydrogenase